MSEISLNAQRIMQIIINDFCKSEYDCEADFGDCSKIPLAYTSSEDGLHEIQVYADIEHLRIRYYYDGFIFGEELFKKDSDMIDFLKAMTFDSLVTY